MDDDDDDDDDNDEEFESKFVSTINCISQFEIKEEVIIPENISDGESTLSDNEKNLDTKLEECTICCKYQCMFIILKNHDCQSEGNVKCTFCSEISHWSNCVKTHIESHHLKRELDHSSDSTASDFEENEEKCKVCLKYEFMVPLLKSHICQLGIDSKCLDCSEVLHWMTCYEEHVKSHKAKDFQSKVKEGNSSDSTLSDTEEVRKLLSPIRRLEYKKCQVCLKYQSMFVILKENHLCDGKPDKNCAKCSEIIQWYCCFDKHKNTHKKIERNSSDNNCTWTNFLDFSGKFDCGICLKLNSIVTHLVKHHKCSDNKNCLVCQEVSYWLSCLKNHKQSETMLDIKDSEDIEVFKCLEQPTDCTVCLKFRTTIFNLSNHACFKKRKRLKCETCLEVSFWCKNFRLHVNLHTKKVSSFKNFYSCSYCRKRFSEEKMLNVHKSYCKSSDLVCDISNRKFFDMFSLKKQNFSVIS